MASQPMKPVQRLRIVMVSLMGGIAGLSAVNIQRPSTAGIILEAISVALLFAVLAVYWKVRRTSPH